MHYWVYKRSLARSSTLSNLPGLDTLSYYNQMTSPYLGSTELEYIRDISLFMSLIFVVSYERNVC